MLAFVPIYGHPVVLFCTDKRVLQPQNRKEKKEGGRLEAYIYSFIKLERSRVCSVPNSDLYSYLCNPMSQTIYILNYELCYINNQSLKYLSISIYLSIYLYTYLSISVHIMLKYLSQVELRAKSQVQIRGK